MTTGTSDRNENDIPPGGILIDDIYIPPPPPPVCSTENTGPRLVIVKIVNEFFKSYGGNVVLGPFHKNFTSIIGPNGSGKSNVIDSMLFVFGFRAAKIRSKKVSVLIHKSDAYPDVNSCTVSVHFAEIIDKDTDFEVIPNSEFVISRTAFKDNSSHYQVNGKKVPFKEVESLLNSKGVDLEYNRFLILQGEVEHIAMMKPKSIGENDTGMLEYLEDVIGSSRYREPLLKINDRIEELSVKRQEKLNRVKITAKEKSELEGPRKDALEYLKKSNSLVKRKNFYLQYMKLKYEQNITSMKEEVLKLQESYETKQIELSQKVEERKKQSTELDAASKECSELNEAIENLKGMCKDLETEDMGVREDLARNIKHLNRSKTEMKRLLNEKEKLEKAPGEKQAKIEELKAHVKDLEKKRIAYQDDLDKAEGELKLSLQPLIDDKAVIEPEALQLQQQVHASEIDKNSIQSELDLLLSKEQKEAAKRSSLLTKLKDSEKSLKERTKSLEEIRSLIPSCRSNHENLSKQLTKAIEDEKNVSKKLYKIKMEIEESKSQMTAASSRNTVLNAINHERKNGRLMGVCGRLGDLGAIDSKYDVAISTSCSSLNSIVVDTTETATNCINFLKRNNIGFATFMPLDKMKTWIDRSKVQFSRPQNVPRLFDLVKMKDEMYRGAFYCALRDTLVANNLDQATQIGLGAQRHRVVTLQGQLIEPSGTMSGGGNRVSRGGMGSSIIADTSGVEIEIKHKEKEVDQLSRQHQELLITKADLEESLKKCIEELKAHEKNELRLQQDIKSFEQQIKSFETQLSSVEKNLEMCKSHEKEKIELSKQLNLKQKICDEASARYEKVKVKVDKVVNKIKDVTDMKTKKPKSLLADVVNKLKEASKEICQLEVSISTGERKLVTVHDDIASHEQNKLGYEKQIEANRNKLLELEQSYKDQAEKIKELEKQLTSCQKKLSEARAVAESWLKEENSMKVNLTDMKREIEKLKDLVISDQQSMKKSSANLLSLKLFAIEDEEEEVLKQFSEEELDGVNYDLGNEKYKIVQEEEKLADEKPNLGILKDYKKVNLTFIERSKELDVVTEERDKYKKHYDDLRNARVDEFMTGFVIITKRLKEMYQMITLGGDADLELVDTLDPFSEGINFTVRPPKKSWKNISYLSGGEKTLASLSLVFALHYYHPTCLYVMDEIDAALDFRNVSIVANYIKERTKNAQFIIISLRPQMFEIADRLVGIYKTFNSTKTITIEPSAMIKNDSVNNKKRKLSE